MNREPDGLVGRIRQIRRSIVTPDPLPQLHPPAVGDSDQGAVIANLQTRVAELEQLVQGLQDSVYRESKRQDRWISELESRIDPGALAAALSRDARDRGL
ncbi:MAG: hypothetical protein ACR2NR_02790 [Solirubrobacteraceae bacterium]